MKEEIDNAKQQKWKDVVEEAINTTDDKNIWTFIKSISGTPDASPTGEVMLHNGRRIASNKGKAEIFSSHYASVSRLKFTKEERNTNRDAKKMLNSKSVDDQTCSPFTIAELK